MTNFIQLHYLISYPPSNLNRDDLGRPKTAIMGGRRRLRVSSQSLKRAWRTSELFESALAGHVGIRTRQMGTCVAQALISGKKLTDIIKGIANPASASQVPEKKAWEYAQKIAAVFGKLKKGDGQAEIEQLAHFSPDEIKAIEALCIKVSGGGGALADADLALLTKRHKAADIAMFGRMLADSPGFNTEAAVQVAHAITVHEVAVEDDYFTAVDDLNRGVEDMGAGHIGESEFGAGVFYLYLCIDRDLLVENVSGDAALANQTIRALAEAAAKVSPSGKQASYASRAYASYILAEVGSQQPRSLSVAFLSPVAGDDQLRSAIAAVRDTRSKMEKVYGPSASASMEVDATAGSGSLAELLSFIAGTHA
jgi:CRISPR system Cascade subunit CasC